MFLTRRLIAGHKNAGTRIGKIVRDRVVGQQHRLASMMLLRSAFRPPCSSWFLAPTSIPQLMRCYSRDRTRPPNVFTSKTHQHHHRGVAPEKFDYFHARNLPQTSFVPDQWPQVPLMVTNKTLIFPRFTKTIEIADDVPVMNAIRHQIAIRQPYIGVFLRRSDAKAVEQIVDLAHIHRVGTFVHVLEMKDYGDRMTVTLSSVRRILATSIQSADDVAPVHLLPAARLVSVDNLPHEEFVQTTEVRAITQEIVKTFRDIVNTNPLSADLLQQMLEENQYVIRDTVYLCDLGASITTAPPDEQQAVMAETNIPKRLMATLQLLKRELEQTQLQRHIGKEVEDNVKQLHRKFILMEQVKVIKKELGIEKDDREAIAERFETRIRGRQLPAVVDTVIAEELKRLRSMEGYSADFNVVRNYLDWLTGMPWSQNSAENLDIELARTVLDTDHFGMQDVKQRILEFVAVSQLKGSTQGKILCFHGPPGVGKTSIARSIATSLNRAYYRFSVGGMTNAAEVKGHRRTYVGAMPGKVAQCLKTTQTENPLVLIDEIDKIGRSPELGGAVSASSGGGDPAAALLELLDPEQNASFMDFYLDVPIDLSRVLFICTANVAEAIPPVLADRMELIEMTGYVGEEKIAIAQQYLIPRALREAGMTERNLRFKRAALVRLIQNYCAESGVRKLQKLIEKVIRKVAFNVVRKKLPAQVVIDELTLQDYLGKSTNSVERLYAQTPPGVVMGLGYTNLGGTVIYVETTKLGATEPPTSPYLRKPIQPLHLTGNLGSVMRESAEIALTVARNSMPDNAFFDRHRLHVHVPKAAQPKDGPSAGVTIVAALQSLAMNRPVRQNMAMTGELSLNGKILPVGGIKEKTIAAKRLGVKCIILPEENRSDFVNLPDFVTGGMEVHFVAHYSDVAKIIFA